MKDNKVILEGAENPFALDFESYNVYGEKVKALTEDANYRGSYKGYSIYKEFGGG